MKKRKAAVLAAAAFAITAACFLNSTQRAEAADNVVVMLDPGHDSTHTGAAAYGLKEQQLNLKIGLACRTELEKYDGITVYMTHDTIACPFEGSTTKQDLIQWTEYAGEVGADLFVSLHNNSGDDSGYEIYYPNNHYVSEFNDIGYAVSEHIAGYLSEMGIYRNGLYTRDSDGEEDDDTNWYPDGSRADYYSVIRNSKYNGVPGIIVEHAYLSDAGIHMYFCPMTTCWYVWDRQMPAELQIISDCIRKMVYVRINTVTGIITKTVKYRITREWRSMNMAGGMLQTVK